MAYMVGTSASPTTGYEDHGDFGVGEKLLFLLQRFNALSTLIICTREVHRCIIPENLGVRKFKFAVVCAKLALEYHFSLLDPTGVMSGSMLGDSMVRSSWEEGSAGTIDESGSFGFRHMRIGENGSVGVSEPSITTVKGGNIAGVSGGFDVNNSSSVGGIGGRTGMPGPSTVARVALQPHTSTLSDLALPQVKKMEKLGEVNNFRNRTPRGRKVTKRRSAGNARGKATGNAATNVPNQNALGQGSLGSNSATWLRAEVINSRGSNHGTSTPPPPSPPERDFGMREMGMWDEEKKDNWMGEAGEEEEEGGGGGGRRRTESEFTVGSWGGEAHTPISMAPGIEDTLER